MMVGMPLTSHTALAVAAFAHHTARERVGSGIPVPRHAGHDTGCNLCPLQHLEAVFAFRLPARRIPVRKTTSSVDADQREADGG